MKNFENALKSHKSVQLIREGLGLMKVESSLDRKLFVLCQFNAAKLFWFYMGIYLFIQLIFVGVELAFWGETFSHVLDPISAGLTMGAFLRAAGRMGDFLISEALREEPPAIYAGELTVVPNKD
ncbi:TPA: hypothetical protein ACGSTL_001350 [Vibrio parahaemolyticus]|uniref:hypothetical protein n=1 Tax=Vibrio campbellii TaxID=680 RepID=UPI001F0757E2|nr:hypothetical protein [Vibrio campbellii]UMM06795.1 hypothetical protein MKR81_26405 [Vibrio campbellii]